MVRAVLEPAGRWAGTCVGRQAFVMVLRQRQCTLASAQRVRAVIDHLASATDCGQALGGRADDGH